MRSRTAPQVRSFSRKRIIIQFHRDAFDASGHVRIRSKLFDGSLCEIPLTVGLYPPTRSVDGGIVKLDRVYDLRKNVRRRIPWMKQTDMAEATRRKEKGRSQIEMKELYHRDERMLLAEIFLNFSDQESHLLPAVQILIYFLLPYLPYLLDARLWLTSRGFGKSKVVRNRRSDLFVSYLYT